MKVIRPVILSLLTALALGAAVAPAAPVPAAPGGWERVETPRHAPESDDVRVFTSGRWVYVVTPARVRVELLTVLGQKLTEATLPPGSHRFLIDARGIYVLRAASSTYRITL